MTINRNIFRRPAALVSALALVAASAAPAIFGSVANAAQVTVRSIQMSDSTPGATGVTYKITFTPGTTQAATAGLIVDFCSDTPLIGATCAFAAGTVPNVASAASSAGTFATVGSGTPIHTVKITVLSLTSGTPFTINLTNMTNPTTAVGTSFYARILTYSTAANAGGYVPANTTGNSTTTGTYLDYGGVALASANAISITASVYETLTFCVSKLAPGPGCGTSGQAVTTPTLTLGHGTPLALDSSAVDTDTAFTQLSTNASSGAVVNLKTTSSVTCSGLSRDAGATCTGIPAKGAFGTMTAGTAAFGLNVANGTGGTGTVTANANYGPTASNYGMGVAAPFSTFGDSIESSSAACSGVNSALVYAATAATTTPAGVYTTTQSLIATGTF